MTELNVNEINNVGGGVTADRWGRGCTDPNNGQEPKKGLQSVVEFPLMPDIELY
jgi:hypothetical protein